MSYKSFLVCACLVLVTEETYYHPSGRISVDLSYTYTNDIPVWPGLKNFDMEILKHSGFGKFVLQTENLVTPSHIGTHIDAPVHFSLGSWTLDQIPVSALQGPAVVIDVSAKCSTNKDYVVSVQDMMDFERRFGPVPKGAIVLFRTGWGRFWKDTTKFLGTETRDITKLRHPGLSEEVSQWLVNQRSIVGVGLDTVSLDPGIEHGSKSHLVLLSNNKWGLENVANLHKLPPIGSYVYVYPIKLVGASGAPARVVAFY